MKEEVKALDFGEALALMPEKFTPYTKSRDRMYGRKHFVDTPMGKVAFHKSSVLHQPQYPMEGFWETSHNEDDVRKEIKFILFALGYDGILLLPSSVILSFMNENYQSRFSGNRIPIIIFKEDGKYIRKGKRDNKLDVTQYFYPNK